jgi:hypothetical protein
MTNRQGKLLVFALGGHSIEFPGGSRLRGYDRPLTFSDWDDVEDGCQVLNKRPVLEQPSGYQWSLRSPLVDVDLAEGERLMLPVDDDNPVVRALRQQTAAGESNQFGDMLQLVDAHRQVSQEPGPCDSVSVSEYVAYWRRLGAEVGVVRNSTILWDPTSVRHKPAKAKKVRR